MQDTFQWTTELVNEYAGTFLLQAMKAIEAARNGSTVEKIISASEFIASKAPKKEWEIVAFAGNGSGRIYRLRGDGKYGLDDYSTGFRIEQLSNDHYGIHSVRRLSDGEVFVKNEVVGTPSDGQHHIGGFEVRGNFLYVQFSIGQITIEHLQKLPQPILTTSDGVDIFEDREVTVVYLKDQSYSIGRLSGYHPDTLENNKVFADDDKAQKYILENKPLLSLNDVKEVIGKSSMQKSDEILLSLLTALVKQKLNQ